jgi:hypothetical protein
MNNVDAYTLTYLNEYWNIYKKYLKDNKNKDIDYPNFEINFK